MSAPHDGPIEPGRILELEGIPETKMQLKVLRLFKFPENQTIDMKLYEDMLSMYIQQESVLSLNDPTEHFGNGDVENPELVDEEATDMEISRTAGSAPIAGSEFGGGQSTQQVNSFYDAL